MWQQIVTRSDPEQEHPLTLLSIAVDSDVERVRPFAEGLSFPTAVDSANVLGRLFDFDVVPNGLFLDEAGVLRFRHVGGFDIRRPEIEQQVYALFHADFSAEPPPSHVRQESFDLETLRVEIVERPDDAGLHYALGESLLQEGRAREAEAALRRAGTLDPSDWSAPFALGTALWQQGRGSQALAAWRTALSLDPHNFTVRKQIWKVEHPERFYPDIDLAWQQEQLQREGYTPPG